MHAGDQSRPAVLLLGLLVFATCIPTQAADDLFNFVLRCPLSDSRSHRGLELDAPPPGLKPQLIYPSVHAGLKTRSPGLKVRGWHSLIRAGTAFPGWQCSSGALITAKYLPPSNSQLRLQNLWRPGLTRCRKTHVLCQGTTLSRAVKSY